MLVVALGSAWTQSDHRNQLPRRVSEDHRKQAEERLADYTLWLDLATLALAGSTLGLRIVTWRGLRAQSRATRRSLLIAADTARATQQMVAVSISGQRPYLMLVDILPSDEDGKAFVKYKIANIGTTPAILHKICVASKFYKTLPDAPRVWHVNQWRPENYIR